VTRAEKTSSAAEARPPEDFYRDVLVAGAKPAYVKCLFDAFAGLAKGTVAKPDEILDDLPALIGRKPKTLADFARKHADEFRY
jgi:NAD(P)H dehydrogenase (quinone)